MIAPPLTGRPFIGNPCAIGVPTPQSLGRPPQKFGSFVNATQHAFHHHILHVSAMHSSYLPNRSNSLFKKRLLLLGHSSTANTSDSPISSHGVKNAPPPG
jgi:hypothetical protein